MSLVRSVRMGFPEWSPTPLKDSVKTSQNAELKSYEWTGELISCARLCELNVPGKFTAETLVIYPSPFTLTPIFGTEYISIADKKFFGAIDFHPLYQTDEYAKEQINEYLYDFPPRYVEESKFYDLSKYFSQKFWHKKSEETFHEEYSDWVDRYLSRYRVALIGGVIGADNTPRHAGYDRHMAKNDPAHGILKAYFSEEFANLYIEKFLFRLSGGS